MAQSAASLLGSPAALGLVGFLLLLPSAPGGPFVLAGSPADRTPAKCRLIGKWRNELGSTVNISAVDNGGFFSGSYQTAVSSTSAPIKPSPLRGFQNLISNRARPTFGFTVRWKFSSSITVFTGQCFVDNGTETLQTTWLLRSEASKSGDNWGATRVGTNVFTRDK